MKRVLWGLAIIIIPAFALFGVGSGGRGRNAAGVVFGKPVPINEYITAYEAVVNRARLTGIDLNSLADQIDLEGLAWERVIKLHEAKRKRIRVSNEDVITVINSMPFFRNEDGSFNPELYKRILANAFRKTPRSFEEDVRSDIMIAKLEQAIRNTVVVSEAEIDEELVRKEAAIESPAQEGEEEKETPEDEMAKIKAGLLQQKRFKAMQDWRADLLARAALVNNLKQDEEEVEEEDTEEQADEEQAAEEQAEETTPPLTTP